MRKTYSFKITRQEKSIIIGLYRQGNTYGNIAELLLRHPQTIKKIIAKYFKQQNGKH